jgi:hypothetical protein
MGTAVALVNPLTRMWITPVGQPQVSQPPLGHSGCRSGHLLFGFRKTQRRGSRRATEWPVWKQPYETGHTLCVCCGNIQRSRPRSACDVRATVSCPATCQSVAWTHSGPWRIRLYLRCAWTDWNIIALLSYATAALHVSTLKQPQRTFPVPPDTYNVHLKQPHNWICQCTHSLKELAMG